MANNSSIVNKLKSFITDLFKSMPSLIDGYEVSDGQIENQSGQVSAEYTYHPTIAGNETDVRVKITATNVSSAFNKVVDYIDSLTFDSITENSAAIKKFSELTGITLLTTTADEDNNEYKYDKNGTIFNQANDISLTRIENSGKGLLGIKLEVGASPDDIGEWNNYAFDSLKYTLECETDVNDKGTVTNQNLMDCVTWIHKYFDMITPTKVDEEGKATQLSHKEKESREKNKNDQISANKADDALNLVMPILATIQGELKKLYQEKLNSDLSLDELIAQPEENNQDQSDNQTEETQSEESEENNTEEGDQMASKHITMKLQKIQGSEDIALIGLSSNYLPGETLDDIDNIINQEEFASILTEEPQSFAISVDDEGYDIDKCEECNCDPCASLCEVFKSGIRAYRNLYIIHWMSNGNDMMKLHLLAEDMYKELAEEIDTIGELLVEKQGTVPQLDFECDYVPVQNYDFQSGLTQIQSLIQMYIDCIDYAYCNQDSDVQSTLDEWLRYWNKQLNYFVKRQEA